MVEESRNRNEPSEQASLRQSQVAKEQELSSRKRRATFGIIAICVLCIIAGISTDMIYSNAFEDQPQIFETLADIITSVAIFSLTFWGIFRLRRHLNTGSKDS